MFAFRPGCRPVLRRFGLTACSAAAIAGAACGPVSQDQEVAIGAQAAQDVSAQLPILADPLISAYVDSLGRAIARRTARADLAWHFAVVNTDVVNAFALPGGYVYVNRGVLARARTMSELAGVLGHEIEHVVRRHSVRQMQQTQEAQTGVTIVCMLTHVCTHAAAQVGINLASTLAFARFSRTDEQQADEGGFQNVLRAGVDPAGMLSFFEVLAATEQAAGGGPSLVTAWFTDHPGTQDRIADIRRMLATLPADARTALATDDAGYQAVRARLRELPAPPTPTPAPDTNVGVAPLRWRASIANRIIRGPARPTVIRSYGDTVTP